ncbi:hypothetical protein Rt10032_c10g4317 [Rhodotorula toruloides]|uniref:Alpha/beta hydrolase fold-3 domain-containing protein n=1 Tax=Rhodotorula toruloides TaxID=5286 RepID=A0A511KIW7_RHOTO|nr:hypothetical protein Rt10032_c10g4317 [Rhodotorula toruloides]
MGPSAAEEEQNVAGLAARSVAAAQTAWRLKAFIPTVLRTTASYYIWGPVARYQATSSAAERRLNRDPSKPLDQAKVMQASRKRLERWMGGGGQPKGGAVWEINVGVKERELKGILEDVDSQEKGDRTFKAEWVAHRSLLTGEQEPEQKVILYAHGGAYTLLSPKTRRALLCQISKETRARVLSIDYRLSPETKFPGALHDAVSAYLYLTTDLGIPAGNGDSAGGNLVTALMLYLRDEKLPQVARAGVDVTHEIFRDGVHVFQALTAMSSAAAALRAIGKWAKDRPARVEKVDEEKVFGDIDAHLKHAWEGRDQKAKAEPGRKQSEREKKAAQVAKFMYERVIEEAPPIRLRRSAHEAAKKALEENEHYKPREGLTTVFVAKKAPSPGLLGRLFGSSHL